MQPRAAVDAQPQRVISAVEIQAVRVVVRQGAVDALPVIALVLQDVPPFMTVSGYPAKLAGTNNEGLRRRGFPADDIAAVRRAYKILYREGLSLSDAKKAIDEAAKAHRVLSPLAAFLAEPGRGIVRRTRQSPEL